MSKPQPAPPEYFKKFKSDLIDSFHQAAMNDDQVYNAKDAEKTVQSVTNAIFTALSQLSDSDLVNAVRMFDSELQIEERHSDVVAKIPKLKHATPLVLYFPDDAARNEFIDAMKTVHPNLTSIKI